MGVAPGLSRVRGISKRFFLTAKNAKDAKRAAEVVGTRISSSVTKQ